MADVHNKRVRSYNMSRIQGKNTKPEMIVRRFLHSKGFRYRLHVDYLPGKPDLVLPKHGTVIFVHGCFWHAHERCNFFKIPETRKSHWKKKLLNNRDRDKKNIVSLKKKGWKVKVIWECDLKNGNLEKTMNALLNELNSDL